MKNIFILLAIFGTSFFGAWLSTLVRKGHSFFLVYFATFLSASIWLYIVKFSNLKLATASVTYDITMSLGYLAGFIFIVKEPISLIQGIGIVLALASVILMNWKSA